MKNLLKLHLPFVTAVLLVFPALNLCSQTILQALKSKYAIYVTFNQNGCEVYPKIFECGGTYEVSLYSGKWHNKGYHVTQGKTIIKEYNATPTEPGPRNPGQGDVGIFNLFGLRFAFNIYGQVYKAGNPDRILGIIRTTPKNILYRGYCLGDPIPYGWVLHGTKLLKDCITRRAGSQTILDMKKIDGMDVGSEIEVCSLDNLPAGWMAIDLNPDCNCCGGDTHFKRKIWKIKKIGGLPKGTIVTICAFQEVPEGWTTKKTIDCDCCGQNPGKAKEIEKN